MIYIYIYQIQYLIREKGLVDGVLTEMLVGAESQSLRHLHSILTFP